MRTKGLERGVGLTFLVLTLVALVLINSETMGAEKVAASAKPIELKFAHFLPPQNFLEKGGWESWAKAIEGRTGGRIKVTFYPGETLCKGKDDFDSVVTGVADVAFVSIAFTPGLFPLTEIFFLPPMGNLTTEDAAVIYKRLYEKFPQFQREYSKVKMLWLHTAAPTGLLSAKKAIHRLEDFEKMLIRAVGPAAEVAKALGATPVNMTPPDIYMAMERGTVDAALIPYSELVNFKLHEVTKYITLGFQSFYAPLMVAMNLKVWNSLPPDMQKIIDEESPKVALLNARAWDRKEREGIELMKQKGAVILLPQEEAERWRGKMKPLWEKWIAGVEAKGLPGKQVSDEMLRLVKECEKKSK